MKLTQGQALEGRLRIECVYGEVTHVLGKIQSGLADLRENLNVPDAPKLYDRIHLSSSLKYIGGPLEIVLFIFQSLRPIEAASVTSKTLSYNHKLQGELQYLAKCLLMGVPLDIAHVWNLQADFDEQMFRESSPHLRWQKTLQSPFSFYQLLPREDIEHTVYAMIFRIMAPAECNQQPRRNPIFAPFNLMAVFRILTHLFEVGYPAHWLSEILQSLLNNNVVTTARHPLSQEDTLIRVSRRYRPKKIRVDPYLAQLTTLASIWATKLPFGLLNAKLCPKKSIRRYTLEFEHNDILRDASHFVLVFIRGRFDPAAIGENLRKWLTEDDKCKPDERKRCERGLTVVDTFIWNTESRRADFMLRCDVMATMRRQGAAWSVLMVGADHWSQVTVTSASLRDDLVDHGRI